jgi:hypothetical protein
MGFIMLSAALAAKKEGPAVITKRERTMGRSAASPLPPSRLQVRQLIREAPRCIAQIGKLFTIGLPAEQPEGASAADRFVPAVHAESLV